jgi:cell division protein ZapA
MEELNTTTVRVNIYGDEYPIKGNADPEYIYRVANYVDGKMRSITEKASPRDKLKVAILAAFNIASELFEIKSETGSDTHRKLSEFHSKTEELSKKIEQSLI